jgi:hypothetical protein
MCRRRGRAARAVSRGDHVPGRRAAGAVGSAEDEGSAAYSAARYRVAGRLGLWVADAELCRSPLLSCGSVSIEGAAACLHAAALPALGVDDGLTATRQPPPFSCCGTARNEPPDGIWSSP